MEEAPSEPVSSPYSYPVLSSVNRLQTIKGSREDISHIPIPPIPASQGRAAGRLTVGRGDLDQAIRSMRDGKRRARPARPLSKIFLDGGRPQSQVFN